ncbi:MAG: crcB [Rhodospirillales bacterium]|jgi:CrcB protein|nr:crcB [Rhodospirillales bacterium]
MMLSYAWVALGGALGSVARFWMADAVAAVAGPTFPWGTLGINIIGSFVIGLFYALTGPGGRFDLSSDLRTFVMVGLCGGFTTFSSFSLQTLLLLQDGHPLRAGGYILGSVSLCLLFVWLGSLIAFQRA